MIDIVNELITYDINVTIFDPWAKPEDVQHLNSFISRKKMPNDKYDSVIFAVSHQEFLNINIKNLLNNTAVFYDVNVCVIGNIVTYRL